MLAQLKKQLKQSLIYYKFVALGGNGDPSYNVGVTVKCMITGFQTVVILESGEEFTSHYTIYVDETCALMVTKDKVNVYGREMLVKYYRPYLNGKGNLEGGMLLV